MTVKDIVQLAGATPVHLHVYNQKGEITKVICSDSVAAVEDDFNPMVPFLNAVVCAIHAVKRFCHLAILLDVIVWGE